MPQGWPDLLRAFSQFHHPCPGVLDLLAASARRHVPALPLTKLASLALSLARLGPHPALLAEVCRAAPSRLGRPEADADNAGRLLGVSGCQGRWGGWWRGARHARGPATGLSRGRGWCGTHRQQHGAAQGAHVPAARACALTPQTPGLALAHTPDAVPT